MSFNSRLLTAITVLAIAGSFATPSIAGEVTGNGSKSDFSEGKSICKFSGLNDIPQGDPNEGPAGKTQAYGQDDEDLWADPVSLDPDGGFPDAPRLVLQSQ